MQSKKLSKKRIHKSIKSLSSVLNKAKVSRIILFLCLAAVLIVLLLFIYFTRNFIFYSLFKGKDSTAIISPLKKMADEEYDKGLLENSAVYYKNYLNSNPEKSEKIIIYRRLFEIAVLGGQIDKALIYLKEIELLDKKKNFVYINRLKLFIRMGELPSAKKEIDLHYKRLKGSTEFKELVGVYYMKNRQYKEAFDILSKIRYGKREARVHKNILHCMLKLEQPEKAIAYIEKLEPKQKIFDDRDLKAEFYIIKAIARAMLNETDDVDENLRPGLVSNRFPEVSIKLLIYFKILNNDLDDILAILNEHEEKYQFDPAFNKVLGDFFIFNKDYHSAIRFYEKIKGYRPYTEEEMLTSIDIYYRLGNYYKAIEQLQFLKTSYNYDTPLLYKNLSAVYKKLGNYSDEFFYLRQGHQQYPGDIGFFVRLAKLHLDNDNPEGALEYIEKGMKLTDTGSAGFDKRLNVLKLAALKYKDKKMTEQELLTLREQASGSVENYFKLIEFYLQAGNYTKARRELNTVKTLPVNDNQSMFLTIYELIYSMKAGDRQLYSELKSEIFTFENSTLTCMYKALIRLLEKDYDESLKFLSYVDKSSVSDSVKFKTLFLESVNFYYKGNLPAAKQKLREAEATIPHDTNASFLEDIIKEAGQY